MAKLSARGRTTVVEIYREYSAESLQAETDRRNAETYPEGTWTNFKGEIEPLPESIKKSLTIWERHTKRLMSDGSILEKTDVRFQPGPYDEGRRHSYGWKLVGKLKAGKTPQDFADIYLKERNGQPSPWKRGTASGTAPVISRTRIMRAVQEDDSTGFCAACGAEQSGVEPDASGYRCKSCGALEVMGAENLLLGL